MSKREAKSLLYEIFDIDPDENWRGPCSSNPPMWDAPEADDWDKKDTPYYEKERARIDEAKRVCLNECPVLNQCRQRLFKTKGRVTGVVAGDLIEYKNQKMPKEAKAL